jgi:hypothetical protein
MSSHIVGPAMVFSSIFNLMGVINVSLILWTRPAILLIRSRRTGRGLGLTPVSSRDSTGMNNGGVAQHEEAKSGVASRRTSN